MRWKIRPLIFIFSLCILNTDILFKGCLAEDITLSGSIIDVPCSIDTASHNQTLDMGFLPAWQLIRNGQGIAHDFTIKLVNCELFQLNGQLPEWRYFRITFDGRNDNGKFAIDGNATGVALQVSDWRGNVAVPGVPLPAGQLSSGNMLLQYSARLVSNSQQLRAGEYSSILRFKIDYY